MKLIFERSVPGRRCSILPECDVPVIGTGEKLLSAAGRKSPLRLPQVSENDISRHYTALANATHGVNDGSYPLGSCTMKYNPKLNDEMASLPGFARIHPLQPEETVQGCLHVLHDAERVFCEITGMDAMTFQPAAGAHGEFTGLLLIRHLSCQRHDGRISGHQYPFHEGRLCGFGGAEGGGGRGYGRSDADQSQYCRAF